MQPGRSCPLHYRYLPSELAGDTPIAADTLYVVGGIYGNRPALEALLALADLERVEPTLAFNGDFNWFDIDPAGFEIINNEVLRHAALRGNVETELSDEDAAAGCGCGYPGWVGDAEVERSNQIMASLRHTARQFPGIRSRLAALPMHLAAEVGGMRIAIVHGDARSLAGWDYSRELIAGAAHRKRIAGDFDAAAARVIASSHTCLPVMSEFDVTAGRAVLINNGAAGMPNFTNTRHGVITRISTRPAAGRDVLYGTRIDHIHVDALALRYDHARWIAQFNANWPDGSPGHASYYCRIVQGPDMPSPARKKHAEEAPHG
jgi:hypothetical protein